MSVRTTFSTGLRGLCVVALAGGLAACASNNKIDFGTRHDMATHGGDDLGTGDLGLGDMAAPDGSAGGCVQLQSWPTGDVMAGYDSSSNATLLSAGQMTAAMQNYLDLSDWHPAGETFPAMHSFSSADTIQSCEYCMDICEGYDAQSGNCARTYFVQSGSLTVDQADSDATVGRFKASGANLKLVEWQDPMLLDDGGVSGDKPVPNGKCYEIASVAFDTSWDNTTDGGADGGTTMMDGGTTTCHPVVNEVLPATTTSAAEEFVEIYNPCTSDIDLTGWKIVYRAGTNVQAVAATNDDTVLVIFPSPGLAGGAAISKIAAGQYLTYWNTMYGTPGTNKDGNLAGSASSGAIAGTKGAVGLRDSAGALVDSLAYGATTGNAFIETATFPALTAAQKGSSISRHPNGADTNDNATDFQLTATPSPKAANP